MPWSRVISDRSLFLNLFQTSTHAMTARKSQDKVLNLKKAENGHWVNWQDDLSWELMIAKCDAKCRVNALLGANMINAARPASLHHGELRSLGTLTVKRERQKKLRENKYFAPAQNKFGTSRLLTGVLRSVAISGDESRRPHTKA